MPGSAKAPGVRWAPDGKTARCSSPPGVTRRCWHRRVPGVARRSPVTPAGASLDGVRYKVEVVRGRASLLRMSEDRQEGGGMRIEDNRSQIPTNTTMKSSTSATAAITMPPTMIQASPLSSRLPVSLAWARFCGVVTPAEAEAYPSVPTAVVRLIPLRSQPALIPIRRGSGWPSDARDGQPGRYLVRQVSLNGDLVRFL